jgi:hypothetical protein
MNTRARLLNGVAVPAVPAAPMHDACPVPHDHGLVGKPDGFNIRLHGPLRYSLATYSYVERTKHLRSSGPVLANARGFCGRPGS